MKKFSLILLITLLLFNSLAVGKVLGNESQKKDINIGLIYNESSDFNQHLKNKVQAEIKNISIPNYQLNFIAGKGENATELQNKLDNFLNDDKIDVVITAGILSSHLALKQRKFNKPLIAPFVLDDELVPNELSAGDQTGVTNLNLITPRYLLHKEITVFKELNDFHQITFLVDSANINLIPELKNVLVNELKQQGVTVKFSSKTESVAKLAEELSGSQAVYISPLLDLKQDQLETLTTKLKEQQIPVFTSRLSSLSGESNILAAYSYREALQRRARMTALNLESYLLGTEVSQLPIYITNQPQNRKQLIINLQVAKELDDLPSWELLNQAKLINDESQNQRQLTLDDAVQIAVNNNLEAAVKNREEKIAESKLQQARNKWKPTINLNTTYTRIREENAIQSKGQIKENTHSGEVELKQVLFNEQVNAQSDIQQSLYQRFQAATRQKNLDVVLSTMTTYYNVLRMKADVSLQQENVSLTKKNLEIAKAKHQLGSASPTDTYRWQSELAMNDSALTQAEQDLQAVKDNLKRVLNLPFKREISTDEVELTQVVSQIQQRFKVANPWQLAKVSDRLVKQGLENSAQLKQLDYAIKAQKRKLKMLQRDFYLPELGLQTNYKTYFHEWGAGTGPRFPGPSKDEWSLGLQATFPLYEGGNKQERLNKAKQEIKKLKQQRQAVAQKLEQQIRKRIRNVNTQYLKYQDTKRAVEAATDNLELVRDAYSQGSAPVAQLLDAQSALIDAKRKRSTIKYDFLIAVAEAKRSLGTLRTDYARRDDGA